MTQNIVFIILKLIFKEKVIVESLTNDLEKIVKKSEENVSILIKKLNYYLIFKIFF